MAVGPYERLPIGGGATADLYLLRFDADGRPASPRTTEHFLGAAAAATDVFLVAHGWNNVFATALDRYRRFAAGYIEQRRRYGLPAPPGYRPVLAGVIWPSTSFVMPWEAGPAIAAAPDPEGGDAREAEEMLRLVGTSLDEEGRAELGELVDGATALDDADARRAAALVSRALAGEDDDDEGPPRPAPEDLLASWLLVEGDAAPPGDGEDFGTVGAGAGAAPVAAGGAALDPRTLLRLGSLWTMKARAGRVGARGVARLVEAILGGGPARLHLAGHSFGARVVLSALARAAAARPAHCALLLQPAVNRWCFAGALPGAAGAGGYRPVLDRVAMPVVTTWSRHDEPLHRFFHLAIRSGHVGEPDIAAIGDTDLYGALGGYGPAGLGDDELARSPARAPTDAYDLSRGRVVAVDGSVAIDGAPAIGGHGDISGPPTWWALHSLTAPS
ncbi:hypothetical protein [Miltoncostaea marina]|uniref:hypothetical protein n=1 Tax=Miltoncostaea marina TaxID=2843215 RepID=UPI001C3E0AAA|nr:hypothetical protein [Miltoncostaea marina]